MPVPPVKLVLVFALVIAGLAVPRLYGQGVGSAPDKGCPDADRELNPRDSDDARRATLCLINRTRAEHGLAALRENATLELAAVGHSKDMIERRFFAHETPEGITPAVRMERAGYRGARRGENLAYGGGPLGTPAEIMAGWMHSAGHRANILDPRWHEIGIGVVDGMPERGAGATYTTNFGAPSASSRPE